MSANQGAWKDAEGDSPDWIELYNTTNSPINLTGFTLSDDEYNKAKWVFPNEVIQPKDFILVAASGKNQKLIHYHTNFKLKSTGEKLWLSNSGGTVVDSFPAVALDINRSYGRIPDGGTSLGLLSSATPNTSNNLSQFFQEISFSHDFGFYSKSFMLQLICEDSVYYTLNGSPPTIHSNLYKGPVKIQHQPKNEISKIPTKKNDSSSDSSLENEFDFIALTNPMETAGTVLRAQAFKNGKPTSDLYSGTFFIGQRKHNFPIVSLITDANNLFNFDTGIYVPGKHWKMENNGWSGNYYERGRAWERGAHIEFYNRYDNLDFSENVGIRIAGKKSRDYPQKSLRVYFRKEYGNNEIPNFLFKDRYYNSIRRFGLRSSFTYWYKRNLLFQDDLIHELVWRSNLNVVVQHSVPSVVFINGEYWGIHNIRERHDDDFLCEMYNIPKSNISIIDGNLHFVSGNDSTFFELMDFVTANDISIQKNYDLVTQQIDIESYIDYFVIETYFNNEDWPGNNMRIWKSSGLKWKWLLYDLDATAVSASANPFKFRTDSTNNQVQLFNALCKNETFVEQFINRYQRIIFDEFKTSRILELIDAKEILYREEIADHIERWKNPISNDLWEDNLNSFRDFVANRNCELVPHLNAEFNASIQIPAQCIENVFGQDSTLTIYPNPAQNEIIMRSNASTKNQITVHLYTSTGVLVNEYLLSNFEEEISINHLREGVYLLRFSNKRGSVIQKFVKGL